MTFFESYRALLAENMPRMKRAAAIIVAVIAFAALTASGLTFPDLSAFLLLSVSVAAVASLIFTYRSALVPAIPAVAVITVFAATRSAGPALFPAASVLPAAALAVLFYKKSSRAAAITTVSVLLGVSFLIILGVVYVDSPELIPDPDLVRTSLTETIASFTVNTANGKVPLYTEDAAARLAEYFVLSIPATVIIVINAVSFFAAATFVLFVRLFGFFDRIPDGKWTYTPELAAAVIYLLSYAVSASLIPYSSADVIGFAAENVLIALIPAMMIAGERALYMLSKKHDGLILFVIVSVVLLLVSPSLYLMIISFSGAFSVIITHMRPYVDRFMRRGDGDE